MCVYIHIACIPIRRILISVQYLIICALVTVVTYTYNIRIIRIKNNAEAFVLQCAYIVRRALVLESHYIELCVQLTTLIVSLAIYAARTHSYNNILFFYCNIIILTCRIVYLHLSRPPASICVRTISYIGTYIYNMYIPASHKPCVCFAAAGRRSVVMFSLYFGFGQVPSRRRP